MTETARQTPEKPLADKPETALGGRVYLPLTDITETETGVTLALEMPGVAPDDVDITLENKVLTIHGKSRIAQPEKLRLAYAEYGEGDYERSFSLTDDFDPDKIEASMQDGVLTLSLPRAAAVLPKKITVTSA